ncbi:MAG: transglycosylase domain-containing protein [Flavobacteriaceae bacterium]|nr:transglycosylase domain-containing protein [Flavobacteriaceae bacterium]
MTKTKTIVNFKKYTKWLWRIFLGGIALIFLLFFLTSLGLFGKLPTFDQLENPNSDLATQLISEDGKTIGKFFKENRTPVQYKDLPQNLVNALIATEDARFYKHSGIDFYATIRAVAFMGSRGGGSTITQQLSKQLFTGGSRNIIERLTQKIKEWIIAIRLENRYTKKEIIAMYFNRYDFLNQAVGIRSASRIYFGLEPAKLSQEQSAMLVGMLKNSSLYNPLRRSEKVKHRRNVVLKQMEKYKFISTQLKDSLQKTKLNLDVHKEDTNYGIATYFREYIRKFMIRWVKDNPKKDGSAYNIYRDGLKIYVTIDSRMQKYAEEAMQQHMENLQGEFFEYQKSRTKSKRNKWQEKIVPFSTDLKIADVDKIMNRAMKNSERWKKLKKAGVSEKEIKISFHKKTPMKIFSWKGNIDTIMTPYDSIKYYKTFLRTGVMSIEPQNGHVKVWVGGINHEHFKYDAVKQQKRQVGSTFKPLVYATAINQLKYSPCKKMSNTPYTVPKEKYGMPKDWTPENAGKKYGGEHTLKYALANSINVISARLIDEANPQNVAKLAKNLGIETKIEANPSIALGAVDLSLFEMIGALSTFANKGMYIKPIAILRIEDKNGTVLQNFSTTRREVVSEEIAYVMLNLMEGVTQAGSGVRLRGTRKHRENVVTGSPYKFTNAIAGKTGTTQNQSDGWFMGMVPNLATGVWVGADDRSVHFPTVRRGQGASMALPIWALMYQKMYADSTLNVSDKPFRRPRNLTIEIKCEENDEDKKTEGDNDFNN